MICKLSEKSLFLKNMSEIFLFFFLNDNETCLFSAFFSQLLQSNSICNRGQDVAEIRLCLKKKLFETRKKADYQKNTYWPDGRRSVEVVFFVLVFLRY